METSKDVYSKHRIIAVTSLKIMGFFGYTHLEEITVRRQDDKLYKFREGDFKRLRREDIEDMLLLLVQGKLTNLNVDERFALNVALRMYPRRILIQERMEDLQLAVESYQKKINLTKLNITNHLMRTDELHKSNLVDPHGFKDGGEEFQRSFRHSDTKRLSRSGKVLKLKNFKKYATLKLFKSTNQERYEHVGPKTQVTQDGKVHYDGEEIKLG
ncbi:hypothetical protein Tco_1494184 [Tanacetum coccineum]